MDGARPLVPVLTVRQPYAQLIALGFKQFEFRSWRPPRSVRGRLISIRAVAAPPDSRFLRAVFGHLEESDRRLLVGRVPAPLPGALGWMMDRMLALSIYGPCHDAALPLGRIVATVEVWNFIGPPDGKGFPPPPASVDEGPLRKPLRWAWRLCDARPASSEPVRGRLGVRRLPPTAIEAVGA